MRIKPTGVVVIARMGEIKCATREVLAVSIGNGQRWFREEQAPAAEDGGGVRSSGEVG